MFSERLRYAMERAGISQAQLARACGVKAPSVHSWLSGKSKFLRGHNLLSAAKVLKVSQTWLATGNGSITPSAHEGLHNDIEHLSLQDCLTKIESTLERLNDMQRIDAGHLLDMWARKPTDAVRQCLLEILQSGT
jgi:transcriptional regulator with XRE-family HTH domain